MTPWRDLSKAEKAEAVRPLVIAGVPFTAIADRLGAPSRNAIAGLCNRWGIRSLISPVAKAKAKQPEAEAPKAERRKPKRAGAVDLKVNSAPRPPISAAANRTRKIRGGTMNSARNAAPVSNPASAARARLDAAFQPLPHSDPCHLTETGPARCKWPVDGLEGREGTSCGAEIEPRAVYCPEHRALAYQPRRMRDD
jgi:hypothetical protein